MVREVVWLMLAVFLLATVEGNAVILSVGCRRTLTMTLVKISFDTFESASNECLCVHLKSIQ